MDKNGHKAHNQSRTKRVFGVVALVVIILIGAFIWYVNDYYHADQGAYSALESGGGIEVRVLEDGSVAFAPDQARVGIVFYPGAKVQKEAYAPLLRACSERGIACVIINAPFNLSLLDVNAAGPVLAEFPEIDSWYAAGHSMGGVAASAYVASHPADFDGVILLASYPNDDLSSYDGCALLVTGSNDMVLNRENYVNAKSKLPANFTEITIEGGNHAYFGNYGEQSGDGVASISRDSQQVQTTEAISKFALAA